MTGIKPVGGCSRPGLEGNTGAAVILSPPPSSLVQRCSRGPSDPGHCLCTVSVGRKVYRRGLGQNENVGAFFKKQGKR